MVSNCSHCGASGHLEYGSDGQTYCSGCLFYGMNAQCWRCRMYLPRTELQMFKGLLYCQYCLMDERDSERRSREQFKEREKQTTERIRDNILAPERKGEYCDRCGRELSMAYFLNGKKLCEACLEQEKKKWDSTGAEGPPVVAYRIGRDKSMVSEIVSSIGRKIGEVISQDRRKKKQEEEKTKVEKIHKKSGTPESMREDIILEKDIRLKNWESFKDHEIQGAPKPGTSESRKSPKNPRNKNKGKNKK